MPSHYKTYFNAPDFDLGPLPGQNGWVNPVPAVFDDAQIVEAEIFSGREVNASMGVKPEIAGRNLDGFGAGGIQWLKVGLATRAALYGPRILLYDAGGTHETQTILFTDDGFLYARSGLSALNWTSTGISYEADKAFTIKGMFNMTTHKWDCYVNGEKRLENIDMGNDDITDIRGIVFHNESIAGVVAVMDDLFIGDFDPDITYYVKAMEIKTALEGRLSGITINMEPDNIIAEESPQIAIHLINREPQYFPLSARQTKDWTLGLEIWCYECNPDKQKAFEDRNDLIGLVENAIMDYRNDTEEVGGRLRIEGGEFENGETETGMYIAGGSVRVEFDWEANIS